MGISKIVPTYMQVTLINKETKSEENQKQKGHINYTTHFVPVKQVVKKTKLNAIPVHKNVSKKKSKNQIVVQVLCLIYGLE